MTSDHTENLELISILVEHCRKPIPRSDCPLKAYREMSIEDQWDAIAALSSEQAHDILAAHVRCSSGPEQSQ